MNETTKPTAMWLQPTGLVPAPSPGFTYANSAAINIDDVLNCGTQEYALRGGRRSGAKPL